MCNGNCLLKKEIILWIVVKPKQCRDIATCKQHKKGYISVKKNTSSELYFSSILWILVSEPPDLSIVCRWFVCMPHKSRINSFYLLDFNGFYVDSTKFQCALCLHREPWRPNKTLSSLKKVDLRPQLTYCTLTRSVCSRTSGQLEHCAGFGWDEVSVLDSSCYGATFWIYNHNHPDNTPML